MKPILFNTDMVRAILEDRKTVTRRVVKLKYGNTHLEMRTDKYGTRLIELQNEEPGVTTVRNPDGTTTHKLLAAIERTTPYCPGDILYVPEPWKCRKRPNTSTLGYEVVFKDGSIIKFQFTDRKRFDKWQKYWDKPDNQWQSPYFMPREAARIFLRVTDVRVERLQEIAPEQLRAEGFPIFVTPSECENSFNRFGAVCNYKNKLEKFSDLWDSTIKPADRDLYGWEANPWVWVIDFERCEKPEGD